MGLFARFLYLGCVVESGNTKRPLLGFQPAQLDKPMRQLFRQRRLSINTFEVSEISVGGAVGREAPVLRPGCDSTTAPIYGVRQTEPQVFAFYWVSLLHNAGILHRSRFCGLIRRYRRLILYGRCEGPFIAV
jgi:hypothetical protein